MSCDSFRTRFTAGTEDPALLEHLRTCDRCLDFAASVDPDSMFRALGGDDMVPPGGIDAFVGGVMQQVRVRDTESRLVAAHGTNWMRRLAIAATIAVGVSGTLLVYRPSATIPSAPVRQAFSRPAPSPQVALATKPVVETYQAENATIVEEPTERADDVKIVMIFDESLPADL